MPAIQCPGCKAHISVPGLIDCPLCQTFLDPPFLRSYQKPVAPIEILTAPPDKKVLQAQYAAAQAAPRTGYKWTGRDWFNVFCISAIVVFSGLIVYRLAIPSDDELQKRKVGAALFACQQRIVGLAEYGGADTPPYVKNYGRGDEFYFAWGLGSFHFNNGFGAPLPMSASCIGQLSTGEIRQMTLNGKDIL